MLAGTSHVEANCLSFLLICPIKIISTVNLANAVTVWLVRKKKERMGIGKEEYTLMNMLYKNFTWGREN